ncbi:MAG: outer membrane protein assembly factor BamA [Paludibacteraceae bacterium]|nr:outer membrane protein assembly factor BamA [Paludibacteraceae bacterium]
MNNRYYILVLFLFLQSVFSFLLAQEIYPIDYSNAPREYEIAEINVTGAKNYENSVIVGFSGLSVGQKIKLPGDEISNAVRRFWKQGMFDDVKIVADKTEGDKIYLTISLVQRPKITDIRYYGLKKSQREDLESQIGFVRGGQVTKNLENQTIKVIKDYFKEKGYYTAEVSILQEPDNSLPNSVFLDIIVDKGPKVKVRKITFDGNQNLSRWKLNKAMKKTNEYNKIYNLFSSKKFVRDLYEADKKALIDKYNEVGFRDAFIEVDSVTPVKDKDNLVDVYIKINEGKKYYFRDISWVGNTLYSIDDLNRLLRIKKGDVYNSKLLNDRLIMDEDAVSNLYQDNGYLFSNIDPVEVNIDGDSIDFEMRIYEGRQAVINHIGITGNTRLYDHVVRREMRTKPGQLYSKSDIMRTMREIAQMGHFDPEKIVPDIRPNPENGTVDIEYQLETKSSDQVELSLGYGATGLTGSVGLKFTNFAIQNIFKPKTYKIVPQGEGQTLSLKATTNGQYYTSVSAQFVDPWCGGKRPNQLSLSVFYSMQSGISSRSNVYSDAYYSSMYSSYDYGTYYAYDIDPDKYIHLFGVSLGFGTRLNWPDDYFTLSTSLSYHRYKLKNWSYFIMTDGVANNLSLELTLGRSSIDNPIYTRSGSSFSLSCELTPPYSAISGKSYEGAPDSEKYKWLEYHKWKFKARLFTPLTPDQKLVLMTRVEYGFLGYYNPNRRSPFGTFYVGGDGMSGGYSSYQTEIVGLRGYASGSLTPYTETGGYNGNLYTRISLELRYPILLSGSTTIFALAFVEGGNCWSEFKDFNPFDLKRSAGVGVRLFLPMFGLMGVDWGYGFDIVKNTPSYSGSHFSFIIGQEF